MYLKNYWWMPYLRSEQFIKQLTPSTIRGLSFIFKLRYFNHTIFCDGDPGTPIPTIIPSYSPTRSSSVMPSTFSSQKPSSVPSLKPSTSPTTDIIQDPSRYPLQHKHKVPFSKITSLTCIHTIYNNTDIHTKASCQNPQSHMCTYTLKQHKHKPKRLLPKTSSFICVHTLYNNSNINTKACFQNAQYYVCICHIQQH